MYTLVPAFPQRALLFQLFLIQNHFEIVIFIPADFAKAVFLVELPGGQLHDRGVQVQGFIAHGAGAGFEFAEDDLAETSALIVRMDAHAFDFGAFRTGAAKASHGHEDAIPFADQKFSLVVEIRFFDGVDIIVPGATPQVGPGLLNGMHMQIFDSFSIGRRVTAQGEHETYPHIFSRIAPRTSSAAVWLSLLISVTSRDRHYV